MYLCHTSLVSPIPLLTVSSEYEAFTDDAVRVRADSTGNPILR